MLKKALKKATPAWLWNKFQRVERSTVAIQQEWLSRACRVFGRRDPIAFPRALEAAGYQVARDRDYYSPLPSVARLRANMERWNRPSSLRGVQYDLAAM